MLKKFKPSVPGLISLIVSLGVIIVMIIINGAAFMTLENHYFNRISENGVAQKSILIQFGIFGFLLAINLFLILSCHCAVQKLLNKKI